MTDAADHPEPGRFATAALDFRHVSRERLEHMSRAADVLIRVLEDTAAHGGHIVGDLIGKSVFTVGDHYPSDDAYDPTTGATFFYHAHDGGSREFPEHGHFHCFVEKAAVAAAAAPLQRPNRPKRNWGLCHLVAVSMDRSGVPMRLFTTNQWVTKEWLYPAPVVIDLVNHFELKEPGTVTPAGEWITSLVALFRPQIEFLLHRRDQVFLRHRKTRPARTVYTDRTLEIASQIEIDIDRQIAAVDHALASQ
jgi:hypothetical protein